MKLFRFVWSLVFLLAAVFSVLAQADDDAYYIDCTEEIEDVECEWFYEWDGEEALPDWYVEDVILLDCGFEDDDEACFWDSEDWYAEYGDGLLSVLDFGEDGYVVLYEPGFEGFGEGFSDNFAEVDSDADLFYRVSGAEISDPQSPTGAIDPELEAIAAEIWTYVTDLIPPNWLELISQFELFPDDGETAAYVYLDENNIGQWVLGVNPTELDDPETLQTTIVHELAHIITLHNGQIAPTNATCSTIELEEGCAFPESYLHAFYQQFWVALDPEFQQIMQLNEDDQQSALESFYRKYRDQFVSDYAATNITEDMAESFMMFVTKERPAGNTIAQQKILFFYNYSELVELRDYMRQGLGR